MTAKEKALQLYMKFKEHGFHNFDNDANEQKFLNGTYSALICCDEILNILEDDGILFASLEYHDKKTMEYWVDVKKEIEALQKSELCPESSSWIKQILKNSQPVS